MGAAPQPSVVCRWVIFGQGRRGGLVGVSGRAVGQVLPARPRRVGYADVGWSLAGRSTFEHRGVGWYSVLTATSCSPAVKETGRRAGRVRRDHRNRPNPNPSKNRFFVFPGQGSQMARHWAMGIARPAYPVFAEAFKHRPSARAGPATCCGPLREVMWGPRRKTLLSHY